MHRIVVVGNTSACVAAELSLLLAEQTSFGGEIFGKPKLLSSAANEVRHERDDKQYKEDEKENLRYARRGTGDAAKSEDSCDDGNYEEQQSPAEHGVLLQTVHSGRQSPGRFSSSNSSLAEEFHNCNASDRVLARCSSLKVPMIVPRQLNFPLSRKRLRAKTRRRKRS